MSKSKRKAPRHEPKQVRPVGAQILRDRRGGQDDRKGLSRWERVCLYVFVGCLPLILYWVVNLSLHAQRRGWMLPGSLGCAGIGAVCVLLLLLRKDTDEKLTSRFPADVKKLLQVVTGVCAVPVVVSELFMFHPLLLKLMDEEQSRTYFVSQLFCWLPIGLCAFARTGIWTRMTRLTRHNAKYLKKLGTGFFDRLWFESVNKEYPIGLPYYVNKVYSVWAAAVTVMTAAVGWQRPAGVPLAVLTAPLYLAGAYLFIFARAEYYLDTYGRVFVLWEKNTDERYDSFPLELLLVPCILVLGAAHVGLLLSLGGVALPWFGA